MNPVSRVCRNALCAPIRFYQRFISPGLGRNCRFTPSCSQYTLEAIQRHGCIKGLLLGAARIARCNPLGRWGFDPVPPKGRWVSPERRLSPAKLFAQAGLPDKAKQPGAKPPATVPPARKKQPEAAQSPE